MARPTNLPSSPPRLFTLPCACQNLRRATRIVTRLYEEEVRKAGLEVSQFGLLTALSLMKEANQKLLSSGFAMDSTTLTRTLALLLKQGWIQVRRGDDRRERIFSLTSLGKRKLQQGQPYWERAEKRLRETLGQAAWKQMNQIVAQVSLAGMAA
jgi:DNA-binding MarR family transcriptional regulator